MTTLKHLQDADDSELSELDRLLNDPETPMQAARVWELLERVSARGRDQGAQD